MEHKIKTYEDACVALNLNPAALPDVSMMPEKHQASILAYCKLVIIAEALNEGWEPDWNNRNEYKYTVWAEIKATNEQPGGVGFGGSRCDLWATITACGSRLCYRSKELALYAGKQFEDLYKELFLIAG